MSFSQLRPLSFGEVLDGAFTLYRRHFASLFLTSLVPQIPTILFFGVYAYLIAGLNTVTGGTGAAVALVGMLVLIPLMVVGTFTAMGGITFQVSRAYTGSPVTSGEAMRRGLSRSGVMFVAYFIVGVLSTVGLLAFIIGALFVWLSAFAVVPAVVLERKGPIESIQRSWSLVKGAWGEVFLVVFVAALIAAMPGYAVSAATTVGGIILTRDPHQLAAIQAFSSMVSGLLRALTMPFSIGATVLLYYDRRVRTEALDVQMLAESLAIPAAPGVETPAPVWQ